jgi:hypothetical protein
MIYDIYINLAIVFLVIILAEILVQGFSQETEGNEDETK